MKRGTSKACAHGKKKKSKVGTSVPKQNKAHKKLKIKQEVSSDS
ncbi:hypothetical protein A2U01_0067820, partial [Trifolium medium]|nr:hypothetical protein [Trifolium medium]